MGVKLQVRDSQGRAVEGVKVFVKWRGGGHSSQTTDQYGIADLNCSAGTAEYVQVNSREVLTGVELRDGTNPVPDR